MTAMTSSVQRRNMLTSEGGPIFVYLVGGPTYTYVVSPAAPTGKTIRIISCQAQDSTYKPVGVSGTTTLTIDPTTQDATATKYVLAYYFE